MTVAERKEIARAHVVAIRQQTRCARCGKRPIQWHNADHPQEPQRRISTMAGAGRTIEEIDAEIAVCTPLCVGCHVDLHRTAQRLVSPGPFTTLRFEKSLLPQVVALARSMNTDKTGVIRELIADAIAARVCHWCGRKAIDGFKIVTDSDYVGGHGYVTEYRCEPDCRSGGGA